MVVNDGFVVVSFYPVLTFSTLGVGVGGGGLVFFSFAPCQTTRETHKRIFRTRTHTQKQANKQASKQGDDKPTTNTAGIILL